MLGYTSEQVEQMATTLNYSIHHHINNTMFADEDKKVLRDLEDFLWGLLAENHV